jgi:hypothetical protein
MMNIPEYADDVDHMLFRAANCLQRLAERTVYEGVCDLVENFEENRIQIVFDGKPSAEVRAELKGNGFRWAPSQSAWQRQLNNAGRYAAKCFLKSQNVEA